MPYMMLMGAILLEVAATSALNLSEGFSRPVPTLCCLALYGLAFYLLSLAVRCVPIGVAYAIWSGVGIVLMALIGLLVFRQTLDAGALAGIGLILCGVTIIALYSTVLGS